MLSIRQPRRTGFTLVELSIVLVIIGLLIGGILSAQSMMKTATLNRTVRELSQIGISISLFKSTYKQLPGDSSLFNQPGNNDGQLNFVFTCDECLNFFAHLSQGVKLKNEVGTDYVSITGIDKTMVPFLSIRKYSKPGSNNYLYAGPTNTNYTSAVSPISLFYTGDYIVGNGTLLPDDAYVVDSKIDDGLPENGLITRWDISGDMAGCRTGTPGNYTYNISSESYDCNLMIDLSLFL